MCCVDRLDHPLIKYGVVCEPRSNVYTSYFCRQNIVSPSATWSLGVRYHCRLRHSTEDRVTNVSLYTNRGQRCDCTLTDLYPNRLRCRTNTRIVVQANGNVYFVPISGTISIWRIVHVCWVVRLNCYCLSSLVKAQPSVSCHSHCERSTESCVARQVIGKAIISAPFLKPFCVDDLRVRLNYRRSDD